MKRIHVFIYGKVQGIFFRYNTKQKADSLNLKGFVRNINNEVEAVFEGEEKAIEEILKFCKKGPIGAKVDKVEVKQEKYTGEFDSFKIRY